MSCDVREVTERLENEFQGFFREKPIVSYFWTSNVLQYKPTEFNENR